METALTGGPYPDSADSSPRSRGAESWDEPYAAVPARLRLMCSYGGHIVPRPHDKSLCYLGGDTRIVVVDRHTSLSELLTKLSRSLLSGHPFTLKYQLPSEDLDSLISVTTEEDLENMIEEYDRITVGPGNALKPSRLRLFLFPAKVESNPSSIGSLLDDSKSESWFVDALNGTIGIGGGALPRGLSADSTGSSVNCLLGLEDDTAAAVAVTQPVEPEQVYPPQANQNRPESPEKHTAGKPGQDMHSVPDSPLDNMSSFESASSAPILSNLPPIRVRPEDQGPDPRGLEEQMSQMSIPGQKQDADVVKDVGFVAINPNMSPTPVVLGAGGGGGASTAALTTPMLSPTENPNYGSRAFLSDEEKLDQSVARKLSQLHPKPSTIDPSIPQRTYYPERNPSGVISGSDAKQDGAPNVAQDSNFRLQMQSLDPNYLMQLPPEKFQQQQQQQHQPQQQYVPVNPQLVQQQTASPVVQYQPFYQMQPHLHSQQQLPSAHAYNQQIPMYFLPIQANPNYGMPVPQPSIADTAGKPNLPIPNSLVQVQGAGAPAPKPELISQTNMYRTSASSALTPTSPQAPQLIQLADQSHQQFIGYHLMQQHHPSHSVAPAGYRYEYPNPVHPSQIYFTQAMPTSMSSQYQIVSSAASTDAPSDVKQTRAIP